MVTDKVPVVPEVVYWGIIDFDAEPSVDAVICPMVPPAV